MTTARDTLIAQSIGGGITLAAREGRTVLFGRQADEVHVCVGADDQGVSRKHGAITYEHGRWHVHNTGRRPMHLPSGALFPNAEPVPLAAGYTALFVSGSGQRRHLLELFVVGSDGSLPRPRHDDGTHSPASSAWPLSSSERLALTVLGRRYLRNEPNAQPLARQEAAEELTQLDPDGGWTYKRVEHRANDVRKRLSARGVPGLTAKEVPSPIGNQLNHNLLVELVRSGTLGPADLARLDDWADG
ncbi:hypothetical protein BJF78_26985 [Pseudonocardia sp. CNS-139]|nr:hypothetical protein BJF78_26985 [Pseudonocardia sp. CNS-139]